MKAETETADAWPRASTRRGGSDRRGTLTGRWAVLAGTDTTKAEATSGGSVGLRRVDETWFEAAVRGPGRVLVYSQGTGSASALVPNGDGTLEVAAVLGMRWRPGKVVSERSLRGLRPLGKACP